MAVEETGERGVTLYYECMSDVRLALVSQVRVMNNKQTLATARPST